MEPNFLFRPRFVKQENGDGRGSGLWEERYALVKEGV
jgi:hypothetical protein